MKPNETLSDFIKIFDERDSEYTQWIHVNKIKEFIEEITDYIKNNPSYPPHYSIKLWQIIRNKVGSKLIGDKT